MSSDARRTLASSALFLVALVGATALARLYSTPLGVSLWWPPAAIMFVYLVTVRPRIGVPVALTGRVLAAVTALGSTEPLWGIALVGTPVVAAYALAAGHLRHRVTARPSPRLVARFVLVAALAAPLAAAVGSRTAAAALGAMAWTDVTSAVASFVVGDAVAVLTLTPSAWVLWAVSRRVGGVRPDVVAGVVASAVVAFLAVGVDVPLRLPVYAMLVPLVIVAVLHGMVGAALANAAVALVVAGTLAVQGAETLTAGAAHSLLFVLAALGLLIAAIDDQRRTLLHDRDAALTEQRRLTTTLERQRAALDTFSRRIAHDLNGPLATVAGMAELLRHPALDDGRRDDLILRLGHNARAAADLVAEVLEDARGTDLAAARATDLVTLRGEVERLLAPLMIQRGVDVRWRLEVEEVPLPSVLVKQILLNLVTNALKYGSGAPEPRIDIVAEVGDEGFGLTVTDNGAGVDPDEVDAVFAAGYRSATAGGMGEGLGLSLCRSLVEELGGAMGVDPHVEVGARFTVLIPLAEASTPAPTPV